MQYNIFSNITRQQIRKATRGHNVEIIRHGIKEYLVGVPSWYQPEAVKSIWAAISAAR